MLNNFFLTSDMEEIVSQLKDIGPELSGKNILLAGAGGFLGRYFIEVFKKLNVSVLDKPCHVIGVDNFIATRHVSEKQLADKNIEFFEHNIAEPFECDLKFDYIIHAAGIASPYHYRAHPLATLEVSTTGSRRLLDLAAAHRARYVFFSSSEIYGDPDSRHMPIPESYRGNVSCMGPRACYDESKRLGETLCYIFHNTHGVHTNTIRPFNVYGPGMQERDYRVLPNFASSIK